MFNKILSLKRHIIISLLGVILGIIAYYYFNDQLYHRDFKDIIVHSPDLKKSFIIYRFLTMGIITGLVSSLGMVNNKKFIIIRFISGPLFLYLLLIMVESELTFISSSPEFLLVHKVFLPTVSISFIFACSVSYFSVKSKK